MTRSRSASAVATNQSRSVALAASLPTDNVNFARTVALNSSMSWSGKCPSDLEDGRGAEKSRAQIFVGIHSRPCQCFFSNNAWGRPSSQLRLLLTWEQLVGNAGA